MIGELVHCTLKLGRLKTGHIVFHGALKIADFPFQFRSRLITVLLHPRQKPGQRLHKRVIIHNRIPLIALFQPVLRIAVMFRQNNCIRIRRLYGLPEIAPESVIILRGVTKISRDVESPSVGIIGRRHPFCRNPHNIFVKLPRSLVIELWQRIVSPPSLIRCIVGPRLTVLKAEKIPVRTVPRNKCARLIIRISRIDLLPVHPFVK